MFYYAGTPPTAIKPFFITPSLITFGGVIVLKVSSRAPAEKLLQNIFSYPESPLV